VWSLGAGRSAPAPRSSANAARNPQDRIPDARYSRAGTQDRYSAHLQKQRRRRKIIRNIAIGVLAAVVVGVGAAWAYVGMINGNLSKGLDSGLSNSLVQTNMTKEPFYMVLMGTDDSIAREGDNSTEGTYRTDTIMLARIDPVNKKVTLVSMPRDTQVTLTGYGTQKLNAAYALGGSSMAVNAVSSLAGVGISHFALVDMDGLEQVVDALGGIQVDVPMTIDDADAGGHLDAGQQTLTGAQALILCRSRHAYDDYGSGDLYRAANQRLVLQAIANKLLSSDVATIANTITALSNSVSTDLKVNDIIGLAQAMQGMDTSQDLYSATMPTTSVYQDDLWYEKVIQDQWKTMMSRVDQGLSPTQDSEVDTATGTVLSNAGDDSTSSSSTSSSTSKSGSIAVRNGSGTAGAAQTVSSKLTKAGYTVSDTGNADSFNYAKTLVIYSNASQADEARAIADTLGGGTAQINDGSYTLTGDFLVVIGQDYVSS
jgi:LCP family protein required for cell wall assembly